MEKKNQVPKYPLLRFPEFTDEWKKVKLGEVAEIIGGGTPSTTATNYWDGEIVWFNPSEIGKKKYVSNSNRTISFQGLSNSGARLLPKGTVLLTTRATIGEIAIANVECTTNQGFQSVVTGHEANNEYVYYFLSTQKVYLLRHSSGSTFLETPSSVIRNLPLRLPSLAEQKKIAALLSLIDERIEVQNAIIKEQEALKAALLRRLFDRTLRFPEFTDEWKKYQNSEVFEIISEKNTDLRDSNVVSASMNYGVVLRDEIGVDIKYEQESIRGYKVVRDGDYIVHLRSFQGGFAFSRLNGICSPAYTILRPRSNMLEYGFLESYFCSSRFITSLKRVTYGIRDGRSISVEEWMSEKTSLPSLAEQKKIAALLSAIDERIAVETEYAALLQKQKAYLLRQMFV